MFSYLSAVLFALLGITPQGAQAKPQNQHKKYNAHAVVQPKGGQKGRSAEYLKYEYKHAGKANLKSPQASKNLSLNYTKTVKGTNAGRMKFEAKKRAKKPDVK